MAEHITLKLGKTLRRSLMVLDANGDALAPDSLPTFTVYKEHTVTAEVVTVTLVGTGEYNYSWTPGDPYEGDTYKLIANVLISGTPKKQYIFVTMEANERGTDSAATAASLSTLDGKIDTLDTVADTINTKADTLIAAVDSLGPGTGSFEITLTIKDVDEVIIPDCDVWVTPSDASAPTHASGVTDTDGDVTLFLDAGSYRVYRQKNGYNFTSYISITIDAEGGVTVT